MKAESTYSRIILGLFPSISQGIIDNSRRRASSPVDILPITLFSEEAVKQTFADPQFRSLENLIETVCAATQVNRIEMHKDKDNTKEQQLHIEESAKALSSKKRKADPTDKLTIDEAISTLDQQNKQLNNINNALEHFTKQLTMVSDDINTATTQLVEEWRRHREILLQSLFQNMNIVLHEEGLQDLPAGEVDNLLRPDSWIELMDRYQDTGANKELPQAELERILHLKKPDDETYYRIKAYMAIRSVHPSRENMGKLLKRLDNVFERAKQEGAALTEQQIQRNQALAEKIKPVKASIESNEVTLSMLQNKRVKLLQDVAPAEVVNIQDKTRARISETQITPPKPA